jgi:hypothetical protein
MKTARPDRIRSFSSVCPGKIESTGQMSRVELADNADFRKVIKRMDVEASVSSCPQNVTATQRISTPGGTGDFHWAWEGLARCGWTPVVGLSVTPHLPLGLEQAREGTLQLVPSVNTRHRVHSLTLTHSFHFNFRSAAISLLF